MYITLYLKKINRDLKKSVNCKWGSQTYCFILSSLNTIKMNDKILYKLKW